MTPAKAGRARRTPHGWNEFRLDLECMREWLTRDWLSGPGPHPVRGVWRRHDAGASLELMCIGASLRRVLPKTRTAAGGQALLREWRDRIRGTNLPNMRGALFEVYLAGLFDRPEHPVQTVAAGEPGHDFAVRFETGGVLRVS